MKRSIVIDTDNGLGSLRGDVDDGFAVAALLASSERICTEWILPTSGNVPLVEARRNTLQLCDSMQMVTPVGDVAAWETHTHELVHPITFVALGPLSHLAKVLDSAPLSARIDEVVVVGGNYSSRGFLPPLWPFEYNLTKDIPAVKEVFASALPLTFLPLDVAGTLRVPFDLVRSLPGAIGEYLAYHSRRWFRRARLFKLQSTVPVWDLGAAAYVLWPELAEVENVGASLGYRGRVWWGRGGKRPTRVITSLQTEEVWHRFQGLIARAEPRG